MDRRIIKTKKAIRVAFSSLIKEKNISEITVSELSKKADIDRRTFYLHYSAVSDIIREIEDEAAFTLNEEMSARKFEITDFFECLNKILLSNFEYYQCITSESGYYSFQIECKKILKNAITRSFLDKSGMRKKLFDYYAEYVTSGIMALYIKWANSQERCSAEELSKIAAIAVNDSWKLITGEKT